MERIICRAVFLSCCLAPTMLVGAWGVVLHSPGHRAERAAAWERALAARLGLAVRVEREERHRDGSTSLGRVELVEQDTGELVAAAEDVRVRTDGAILCQCGEIEVQWARLPRLWEVVDGRLLRGVDRDDWQLTLTAPQIKVRRAEGEQLLRSVTGTWQSSGQGSRGELRFLPEEDLGGGPARLLIGHELREGRAPLTHLRLLGDSCRLAAPLLSADLVAFAGPDARFHGVIEAVREGGPWRSQARGVLEHVDLARVVPRDPDLVVDAHGDLHLTGVDFFDGRLVRAQGRLEGTGGAVSGEALVALGRLIQVEPLAEQGRLAFDQLHVDFGVLDNGLWLTGRCGGCPEGTILAAGGRPLLRNRPRATSPYFLYEALRLSAAPPESVWRRAPHPGAPR